MTVFKFNGELFEIKRCPFCGSEAKVERDATSKRANATMTFTIRCSSLDDDNIWSDCVLPKAIAHWKRSDEPETALALVKGAIFSWNRRTP